MQGNDHVWWDSSSPSSSSCCCICYHSEGTAERESESEPKARKPQRFLSPPITNIVFILRSFTCTVASGKTFMEGGIYWHKFITLGACRRSKGSWPSCSRMKFNIANSYINVRRTWSYTPFVRMARLSFFQKLLCQENICFLCFVRWEEEGIIDHPLCFSYFIILS